MRSLCLAALLIALLRPTPSEAEELVVDLSDHLVAISTGFAGTSVLLFGAVENAGHVVVVVRGPDHPVVVRRMARIAGVWANEAEMTFERAPSFYAVASSAPLAQVVSEPVATRHQIGVERVAIPIPDDVEPSKAEVYRDALIRNKQRQRLYSRDPARIAFLGNRLFRTDMALPANAPVGTYIVEVFLIRDGDVVSAGTTPLIVSKVGFEARVFDFAHRHSLAYGVLAILIAVLAGWVASAVFRKG